MTWRSSGLTAWRRSFQLRCAAVTRQGAHTRCGWPPAWRCVGQPHPLDDMLDRICSVSGSALTSSHTLHSTPRPPLGAVQVCPPGWFAAHWVLQPARLSALLDALCSALSFSPLATALLVNAPPEAQTSYACLQERDCLAAGSSSSATGLDGRQTISAPLLPRMPQGLELVSSRQTYEAVALACRAVGRAAAAADQVPGSTAVRALADQAMCMLGRLVQQAQRSDQPLSHRAKRSKCALPAAEAEGCVSSPASDAPGLAAAAEQHGWQLAAASLVAVLSETLFGASPAWRPKYATLRASGQQQVGTRGLGDLDAVAALVVQDLVAEGIWGLPTGVSDAGPLVPVGSTATDAFVLSPATDSSLPSAAEAGGNMALQRAALECIGVLGRALGPSFVRSGRIIRAALLPVLEKLGGSGFALWLLFVHARSPQRRSFIGASFFHSRPDLTARLYFSPASMAKVFFPCRVGDPSHPVAASASVALWSVCIHGGLPGPAKLVADNGDYVVDGLCARLRQARLQQCLLTVAPARTLHG